ncbi:MAG: FAD:protein FMN transferase [Gammaproteobacteria bacterium]|nr:FAD:protein FMN transferase [Gammaproteobacteria bacterium]
MIEPPPFAERTTEIEFQDGNAIGRFFAMGCPCEVLIESADRDLSERVVATVRDEAWRIEQKWSRYLSGSVVSEVNRRAGEVVTVDDETVQMIDFATRIFELSEGAFDITSGVLQKVWRFDGSDNVPSTSEVDAIMSHIGWHRVHWQQPQIRLEPGMQLDFGGIGKEYAVDRSIELIRDVEQAVLVNFGGDLACTRAPENSQGWLVGVDGHPGFRADRPAIRLRRGAIATSGDTYRFVHRGKVRYSHVLDARTGWPVIGAPSSVTVMADTCTTAGMLTTLALTHGSEAETFLVEQEVDHVVEW